MDFKILAALKSQARELEETCKKFDKRALTGLPEDSSPLSEIFWISVSEFLLYLTSSDNYIEPSEIDMFNYITDSDIKDVDAMRDMIINSESYLEANDFRTPWIIMIMVRCENALNSINGYAQYSIVDDFVSFFRVLGLTFINIDEDLDENERTDFLNFMRIIDDYVEENLIYQ